MQFPALIESKRDGNPLTDEQIVSFVRAVSDGGVSDYQVSALLMAVFFRGLDSRETRTLTHAMRDSVSRLFENVPIWTR